ncbi:xaa-Pro aminopeptidase 1-like isoform X2 [Clavelina lepadiformis]|uniref:xaa-Pro aminopeptidase 1-like isoform X2 n=1 Tax=Clavelina lepadiformis TaxID=159417 RepID=UPI0040432C00
MTYNLCLLSVFIEQTPFLSYKKYWSAYSCCLTSVQIVFFRIVYKLMYAGTKKNKIIKLLDVHQFFFAMKYISMDTYPTKLLLFATIALALFSGLSAKIEDASLEKHFFPYYDAKLKNKPKLTSLRNCSNPDNIYLPPTATNTSKQLSDLRHEMEKNMLAAYMVPSSDAHLSEYLAPGDRKRDWLTGFSGSAGTAVVTHDKAALWTDGRYFEQAEKQLDCNWILMKLGEPNVPSIENWLETELQPGLSVGANPFLFSISSWLYYASSLAGKAIFVVESVPDLIDIIWTDRPATGGNNITVLPNTFTGISWTTKLINIRQEMRSMGANYFLVTLLDEIAWFFNMRGEDIPYTPVFISYVIIPTSSSVILYINQTAWQTNVLNHLNETGCDEQISCVLIKSYDDTFRDLAIIASDTNNKIWMPQDGTSYGMYRGVNTAQQISSESPLKLFKAQKNPTEIAAMRQAHIYDSLAVCEYLQWLEENVLLGGVNEINGAEKLKNLRQAQPTNRGLSFSSISASGPNSAVIHYGPTFETNRNLTTFEMYVIDSGGQYLGGTTDVTRSMHFGQPTNFQKEVFTRALAGLVDVEMAKFPYNKDGNDLDILARRHLYDVGLEYRHGSGHGIGQYLCVHEYPPGIGTSLAEGYYLQPGMFTSIEPGYYEEGKFGLRHENVVVVVIANTSYHFESFEFHAFEPVTLVPFQQKMITTSLLTDGQILTSDASQVQQTFPKASQRKKFENHCSTRPIITRYSDVLLSHLTQRNKNTHQASLFSKLA